MKTVTWLAVLLAVVLAVGCSDDDEMVAELPCDVTDPACQERVWALVQGEAELDAKKRPPELQLLTPAELEAMLQDSLSENMSAALFVLLGVVDEDGDWLGELVAGARDSIAALYDDETQEMFVVDRGIPLDRRDVNSSLAHELIHALQDQHFDLGALLDATAGDEDGSLGVLAAMEGHASHFQSLVNERILQATPDPDLLIARAQGDFDLALRVQTNPALLWIAGYLGFPHASGGLLAAKAWAEGGTNAVTDLLRNPPDGGRTLLQAASDAAEPGRSQFAASAGPTPLDGFTEIDQGPLGPLLLLGWLARAAHVDAETARELVLGLRADTGWLYRDAGNNHALLWALDWDGTTTIEAQAPAGQRGSVTACYSTGSQGLVLTQGEQCQAWAVELETVRAELVASP
jgi:hypothetical protein